MLVQTLIAKPTIERLDEQSFHTNTPPPPVRAPLSADLPLKRHQILSLKVVLGQIPGNVPNRCEAMIKEIAMVAK